ncbi:MAG: 50S ribosomal protein L11 methyltransferase [Clostridia bacterium]
MTDRGDGDDAGYLLEVTVSVSREKAEIALARLLRVCPGGVLERRGSEGDVDYVLFFSSGAEVPPLPGMEVKSRLIPQVDWEEQARRHFHPVEVGPLRIIAPWMAKRDERDLVIEPGVAFGTGGHESTRLALELLVEALAEGPVDSLLDVGCGTGILALAALRLGVPRAWACDVDAAAVRAARRNSKANDLEAHLKVSNWMWPGLVPEGFRSFWPTSTHPR